VARVTRLLVEALENQHDLGRIGGTNRAQRDDAAVAQVHKAPANPGQQLRIPSASA
jgi:hypothetical protein